MMYITLVQDHGFVYGGFMAVRAATAPHHTWSSIIIVTSLTLGGSHDWWRAVNDFGFEIVIATKVTRSI